MLRISILLLLILLSNQVDASTGSRQAVSSQKDQNCCDDMPNEDLKKGSPVSLPVLGVEKSDKAMEDCIDWYTKLAAEIGPVSMRRLAFIRRICSRPNNLPLVQSKQSAANYLQKVGRSSNLTQKQIKRKLLQLLLSCNKATLQSIYSVLRRLL